MSKESRPGVPVKASVEVRGVQDAVRALRRIDPELRKQFNRDAKTIADPVIRQARQDYPEMPLSGMARRWSNILPWDVSKARRGLGIKIDTSRKARNVILLRNRDKAASVFEMAGRRQVDEFAKALGPLRAHRSRVLGPALQERLPEVVRGFERLTAAVVARTNREMR